MKTVNIAVINDVSLQAADGKEREMLCLPSNLAA